MEQSIYVFFGCSTGRGPAANIVNGLLKTVSRLFKRVVILKKSDRIADNPAYAILLLR
ncbi:MAG: hypothetical protein RIE53_02595 [Rhodothermales bacterium]